MPVLMKIKGGEKLIADLRSLPESMIAGVKVQGPASIYALVWEWGSTRLKKPGPKTLWSNNPVGARVILTLTAPYGYIRTNTSNYIQIIKNEHQAFLGGLNGAQVKKWPGLIKAFLNKAAERCASLTSNTAPIDSGDLRNQIVAAKVGDPALQGTPSEYGDTELVVDWK